MYEYVSRAEYRPYKAEVDEIIKKIHKIMKTKYNTTFQAKLIGSANRHLVTKIKNGNKGYDFDYNFILQKSDLWENPKKLKQQFMSAVSEAIKGTPYGQPEDSTTTITIKVVDKKNSKIIRSCDFAIIYYIDDDCDLGYRYIKNHKNGVKYSFEERIPSQNADWKLQEILECDNGWNTIREEYLELKNHNNDKNKKSFILYLESIHNVYNRINQETKPQNNDFGFINIWQ